MGSHPIIGHTAQEATGPGSSAGAGGNPSGDNSGGGTAATGGTVYGGGYGWTPDSTPPGVFNNNQGGTNPFFPTANPGPPDINIGGVDYTQLGQQQNAANRPNTYGPFGASTQTFDPTTGQWTVNNSLGGPGLAEYNEAQQLAGGLGSMSSGLDTSSLTPWGTAPSYSGATAQQGANDAYAFAKGNLDPQWNQQQTQLQGQLAAQGLHPGDPAYEQQMRSFQTSKDTAYQQANLGAFQTGSQEAATQTGAEATAANTADSQRMQQIQQQLTQSGWTANEINQLLGGPAVSGAPGAAQANPTAANQTGAVSSATAQQQQLQSQLLNNAMTGATGAIAGAASALSDETAKDISGDGTESLEEFLESATPGEYQYKPEYQSWAGEGTYVSPMAQGLETSHLGRDLVVQTPVGKVVDYGKGFGAILASISHVNRKLNQVMGL